MLAILVTHPIQYHVPLWQKLAGDGRVPVEVWYMSEHAARPSRDREFQQDFAWDLEMLEGYPHQFLKMPPGATPNTPWRMHVDEAFVGLLKKTKPAALWVQGWQVVAYWQAVWAAKNAGIPVWLRGESNAMASAPWWKGAGKRFLLGQLFGRVDEFLCIGRANRELYRGYGVSESKLHMAPYAVDNERFRLQAETLRGRRAEIRRYWKIPEDAFCVLFCGKFVSKKRPLDLIQAVRKLMVDQPTRNIHLLFAGSGELGQEMRAACNVAFDADRQLHPGNQQSASNTSNPSASFAGFLNQTEVSRAYVAADVLVLPSDHGETWGLVVNEAMASGIPCIISDHCGCAADLGIVEGNSVFSCGEIKQLAAAVELAASRRTAPGIPPSLDESVRTIVELFSRL